MPHSCHQLSALLTVPLARGGLPPATCPLQEEACLHSADWECPGLPLWPPSPLSLRPCLFTLLSFSFPQSSSPPPSLRFMCPHSPPLWNCLEPHSGVGYKPALQKPRRQGCKSVLIFTSLPEEPTARAGLWLQVMPVILSKVVIFFPLSDTLLHHKNLYGSEKERFHSLKEHKKPTDVPSAPWECGDGIFECKNYLYIVLQHDVL